MTWWYDLCTDFKDYYLSQSVCGMALPPPPPPLPVVLDVQFSDFVQYGVLHCAMTGMFNFLTGHLTIECSVLIIE